MKPSENALPAARVFPLEAVIRALRPHQWTKNFLLFIPLLAGHKLNQPDLVFRSLLAFFSFSYCASATYVLNDLLDLHEDREHPTKCARPFASGALPIWAGWALIPVLLVLSGLLALRLPPPFRLLLIAYAVTSSGYSWKLKHRLFADVLVLSSLYTLRLFMGGIAIDVPISKWLLGFSAFLFISLALVKRASELVSQRNAGRIWEKGRVYQTGDLMPVVALGVASAYTSVLVFILYITSEEARAIYPRPTLLFFLFPALIYWLSRLWILAHRGEIHSDPVVDTLRDKESYALFVFGLLVVAGAMGLILP